MARREPVTESSLKGHRLTVTIEDPIHKELVKNVGKTKRFATEGHAINYSLAKELGVEIKE